MKEKILKRILYGINVAYSIFGLAIAIVGIWFFVVQTRFVALRNKNHYQLDYSVYWPQVVPWIFFVIGLFGLTLGFCGMYAAVKRRRLWIKAYCLCLVFLILGQIVTAILIFVFVDSEYTDRFIKDTVYDGFYHGASNREIESAFNIIEEQFSCCGANDARDYRSYRNDLPFSCCKGVIEYCDFTNKEANERLGCAEVLSFSTKIVSSVVAGVSLFMCLVEMSDIFVAWKLLKEI